MKFNPTRGKSPDSAAHGYQSQPTPLDAVPPIDTQPPPEPMPDVSQTMSPSSQQVHGTGEIVPEPPAPEPATIIAAPPPPAPTYVPPTPKSAPSTMVIDMKPVPPVPSKKTLGVSETMIMVHQEDRMREVPPSGSSPPPPDNMEPQTVHVKIFEKKR